MSGVGNVRSNSFGKSASNGSLAKGAREHRRFGRRKVFKRATISFDDAGSMSCVVADISDGGARIQHSGEADIPDRFELIIEEDDFCVRCEIAHRQPNSFGVRFVGSPRRQSWTKPSGDEGLKRVVFKAVED